MRQIPNRAALAPGTAWHSPAQPGTADTLFPTPPASMASASYNNHSIKENTEVWGVGKHSRARQTSHSVPGQVKPLPELCPWPTCVHLCSPGQRLKPPGSRGPPQWYLLPSGPRAVKRKPRMLGCADGKSPWRQMSLAWVRSG